MDQRHFNFDNNDDAHPIYRQLDKIHQQSLIDLMAALIVTIFQTQEKTHHDQSPYANKDQR